MWSDRNPFMSTRWKLDSMSSCPLMYLGGWLLGGWVWLDCGSVGCVFCVCFGVLAVVVLCLGVGVALGIAVVLGSGMVRVFGRVAGLSLGGSGWALLGVLGVLTWVSLCGFGVGSALSGSVYFVWNGVMLIGVVCMCLNFRFRALVRFI